MKNPNWAYAIKHDALIHNNIWDLVSLPLDPLTRTIIGCKMGFFWVKENDETVETFKTRIIAKQLNQVLGFDFHKTVSFYQA